METFSLLFIFVIGLIIAFVIGKYLGEILKEREWKNNLPQLLKQSNEKSRAILGGQFSENLAPYLPNFPFVPTECKFIGKPIDFIVFNGMNEKDINEVVFVEIKSGKSKLNEQEKKLKEAIDNKKVRWEEYRIPDEITKGR
jgi:predicted Holliday junction resolvase-like endonuclease